jgi:excisionase family DNA binding protein
MKNKKARMKTKHYPKRLLTVAELAYALGLRPQTVYNKMSQGLFPIKHKKLGRLVRFEVKELERYLAGLPDQR